MEIFILKPLVAGKLSLFSGIETDAKISSNLLCMAIVIKNLTLGYEYSNRK